MIMYLLSKKWTFAFQVIFLPKLVRSDDTEYCKIDPKHILCGNTTAFSPECGEVLSSSETRLTIDEVKEILKAHNDYRNNASSGMRYPFPRAGDMNELAWDRELALLSETYVKQCRFEHSCEKCADVERFNVGENLHLRSTRTGGPFLYNYSWTEVVKDWTVDEEEFFSSKLVDNFSPQDPYNDLQKYGHLTQILWSTTKFVGCSRVAFKRGDLWQMISSCHYGPAGNILQRRIYMQSPIACGYCEKGLGCSEKFPNLCENPAAADIYLNFSNASFNAPSMKFLVILVFCSILTVV